MTHLFVAFRRMVVNNVHDDLNAVAMERVDRLLAFDHAASVSGFAGVPAVGRIEVHGHITPVVGVAFFVVLEILEREYLHGVNAEFHEMPDAGFNAVVAGVDSFFLDGAEEFSAVFDRRFFVDGKIAYVHFINHRFIDGKNGRIGDRRFIVDYQGAAVVRGVALRVRVESQVCFAVYNGSIFIISAGKIAFHPRAPYSAVLLFHGPRSGFGRIVPVVKHQIDRRSGRGEHPENRAVLIVQAAELSVVSEVVRI